MIGGAQRQVLHRLAGPAAHAARAPDHGPRFRGPSSLWPGDSARFPGTSVTQFWLVCPRIVTGRRGTGWIILASLRPGGGEGGEGLEGRHHRVCVALYLATGHICAHAGPSPGVPA